MNASDPRDDPTSTCSLSLGNVIAKASWWMVVIVSGLAAVIWPSQITILIFISVIGAQLLVLGLDFARSRIISSAPNPQMNMTPRAWGFVAIGALATPLLLIGIPTRGDELFSIGFTVSAFAGSIMGLVVAIIDMAVMSVSRTNIAHPDSRNVPPEPTTRQPDRNRRAVNILLLFTLCLSCLILANPKIHLKSDIILFLLGWAAFSLYYVLSGQRGLNRDADEAGPNKLPRTPNDSVSHQELPEGDTATQLARHALEGRKVWINRDFEASSMKLAFAASMLTVVSFGVLFMLNILPAHKERELLHWCTMHPLAAPTYIVGFSGIVLRWIIYGSKPRDGKRLPEVLLYAPATYRDAPRMVLVVLSITIDVFLIYIVPMTILIEVIGLLLG